MTNVGNNSGSSAPMARNAEELGVCTDDLEISFYLPQGQIAAQYSEIERIRRQVEMRTWGSVVMCVDDVSNDDTALGLKLTNLRTNTRLDLWQFIARDECRLPDGTRVAGGRMFVRKSQA